MLINELCSMVHFDANGQIVIDPCLPNSSSTNNLISPGGGPNSNRRMDKSTVLQSAINFLKSHCEANKGNADNSSAPSPPSSSSTGNGDMGRNDKQQQMKEGKAEEKKRKDSWKPTSLSHEEFAQLMLEVSVYLYVCLRSRIMYSCIDVSYS